MNVKEETSSTLPSYSGGQGPRSGLVRINKKDGFRKGFHPQIEHRGCCYVNRLGVPSDDGARSLVADGMIADKLVVLDDVPSAAGIGNGNNVLGHVLDRVVRYLVVATARGLGDMDGYAVHAVGDRVI